MSDSTSVIREYANEAEAHVARSVLEANGIPSAVFRDSAGGMLPSLYLVLPVRLAVREADIDRALEILDTPLDDDDEFDGDDFAGDDSSMPPR